MRQDDFFAFVGDVVHLVYVGAYRLMPPHRRASASSSGEPRIWWRWLITTHHQQIPAAKHPTTQAPPRSDRSRSTDARDSYPVYTEFWCDRDADPSPAPGVVGAVIALRIAVGSREYDPEMDIDSDGRVTSLDALMILQAASV